MLLICTRAGFSLQRHMAHQQALIYEQDMDSFETENQVRAVHILQIAQQHVLRLAYMRAVNRSITTVEHSTQRKDGQAVQLTHLQRIAS